MYYTLRIIEKIFIIYFTAYLVIDVLLYVNALFYFFIRSKKSKSQTQHDYTQHSISIIVPAYNEEVSIITCIENLLDLDYPDYQVILVNDGSKDRTMQTVLQHFDVEKVALDVPKNALNTANLLAVYRLKSDRNLLILDKENGGKADAINAGINYASGKYICTIDADSVLDPDALKEVVSPFINNPDTIVTGGQLAVANDVTIVKNRVQSARVPKNIWVQWQINEYIKSFMISRIGLSKINALLIMSGAFSLFKKQDLNDVGGFLTKINTSPYVLENVGSGKQTVCEDMEIVVRLWKYKRDQKRKAKAVFVPEAVLWTEVPDNASFLFRQRSRWHQGLAETLSIYRKAILEPSYGVTGMLALPYYFFFELLSPIMKVLSLVFIFVAGYYGVFNAKWVLLLLAGILLTTAIIMSSITLLLEYWSEKHTETTRNALRYKNFKDWLWLLITGILSEFSYSFFKIVAQLDGLKNFMRKKHDWRKFERKGI